jgi:formate transporter
MTAQHQPAHAGPIDALAPLEMARKAEDVGVRKARTDTASLFVLAILAGAFIALGAIFALTVGSGSFTVKGTDGSTLAVASLPFGVTRPLGGTAFSLGLILVVVAGAELFTGNILLVIAWASHRIATGAVVRNWTVVYAGNFVGALLTVGLVMAAGWYWVATARSVPLRWRPPRARSRTRSSRPWRPGSCAMASSASRCGSPTRPARRRTG